MGGRILTSEISLVLSSAFCLVLHFDGVVPAEADPAADPHAFPRGFSFSPRERFIDTTMAAMHWFLVSPVGTDSKGTLRESTWETSQPSSSVPHGLVSSI